MATRLSPPTRQDDGSFFGMAKRAFTQTAQSFPGMELPKWESVSLYTYGAPRVGNSQFAAYFETLFAGRSRTVERPGSGRAGHPEFSAPSRSRTAPPPLAS